MRQTSNDAMSMTPEELEKLKEAEKAHLRQLRALKQRHREATRKKGVLDALKEIVRPDLDDVHDEMVDRLTMENLESEARLEVALENAGLSDDATERISLEEAEREVLRKAEAEALVRQMKLEGHSPEEDPAQESATAANKTIGPARESEETPPAESTRPVDHRGSKTIGRG